MMGFVMVASLGLNMPAATRLPASRMLMRSMSRFASPSMVELEEPGEFGTTDYSMTFKEGGKGVCHGALGLRCAWTGRSF